MRVAFLCGSLEKGKDGVGDYTRRLAGELIRQGHTAIIISLFDSFLRGAVEDYQCDDTTEIRVLRLPSANSWKTRLQKAEELLQRFKPDWLSLQYVPYAFHPKGIPLRLVSYLRSLKYEGKWHIMFHELWVGKEDGALLRIKLLSYLQRRITDRLIRKLHPAIIHTHLPAYRKNINALGWKVKELPLFSNIQQQKEAPAETVNQPFRVAFFSQIEASPKVFRFLHALEKEIYNCGKSLEIVLLGGSSSKMQSFKLALQQTMSKSTSIIYTGFISAEQLSEWLSRCKLGVTPLLKITLGKSGSVAAFFEHELPVGVPFDDECEASFFYPDLEKALVENPTWDEIERASFTAKKAKRLISVTAITNTFITDLETELRDK